MPGHFRQTDALRHLQWPIRISAKKVIEFADTVFFLPLDGFESTGADAFLGEVQK